jgi:mannan endo-1,4-beta-mannosidase
MPSPLTLGVHLPETPLRWDTLDYFEALVGTSIPIVSFYWAWGHGPSELPFQWMRSVIEKGKQPLVTWEPWRLPEDFTNPRQSVEDASFRLKALTSGAFDDYIADWAGKIKTLPGRVAVRLMHEMNGNWYPWCGHTNGNTPEQYVLTWRYIHDLFRHKQATNVEWVWCPYVISAPPSTAFTDYFPGDEYIDWLGLDGYNWGTSRPWACWQEFPKLFGEAYRSLIGLSAKPLMIAEVGCAECGGSKADWLRHAYHCASTMFPRLRAVVWFNLDKECDWRVESSNDSLAAFRNTWGQYEGNGTVED